MEPSHPFFLSYQRRSESNEAICIVLGDDTGKQDAAISKFLESYRGTVPIAEVAAPASSTQADITRALLQQVGIYPPDRRPEAALSQLAARGTTAIVAIKHIDGKSKSKVAGFWSAVHAAQTGRAFVVLGVSNVAWKYLLKGYFQNTDPSLNWIIRRSDALIDTNTDTTYPVLLENHLATYYQSAAA
jgi:hypothetical protein